MINKSVGVLHTTSSVYRLSAKGFSAVVPVTNHSFAFYRAVPGWRYNITRNSTLPASQGHVCVELGGDGTPLGRLRLACRHDQTRSQVDGSMPSRIAEIDLRDNRTRILEVGNTAS